MNAIEALKPCPFCGGEAEMDSQRSFRMLGSGNIGSAVAIYCLQCSADMTLCHADHPGVEIDALCTDLRDQWNRRAREALSTPPSDAGGTEIRDLLEQCKRDFAAAHTEICKLQKIDPAKHTWPQWSSVAHTLAWIDKALARPSSAGEKLPADRCDFCDNGIESGWAYCPWCSHVLDYTQASERAPEPSAGEKPDADAMREVLVGSYKGLLVLRTMLKRANLTTGMEVTDQWLRDMEKVMPELPGLSALR